MVGSVVVGRSVVLVGHDIGRCSPGASGSTFCLCRPEIPMKFSFSEVTPAFTNLPAFTNPPAFTDPTTFRDSSAPQLPPAFQYPRRSRNSPAPQHPRTPAASPAFLHPGVPVRFKVLGKLVVAGRPVVPVVVGRSMVAGMAGMPVMHPIVDAGLKSP